MGFLNKSPFDADIEKATSEKNTNEDWGLILDICDKVTFNPRNAKECLRAIMKRMGNDDPHIVMHAITLLDACVHNCRRPFHLEIASREFEKEYRRLLAKAEGEVSLRLRQMLKSWAEKEFKTDPELNLIPLLISKLKLEGYDFNNLNDKSAKTAAKLSALKDPNVVSSQEEEDDIAKAIELSLKESKSSPKQQAAAASGAGAAGAAAAANSSAYPSLYPSFAGSGSGSITSMSAGSNGSNAGGGSSTQPEPRKVRALYDFEAAEENELTFVAGEIIHVLDDSDANWWNGYNQRGEGLFPSNFVSADLSVDPERLDINQQQQKSKMEQQQLQYKTEEEAAAAAANQRAVEIDECKVDRLLHLLHEANPEDPSQDSEEMLHLEQQVNQMGPLIDAELERVDRKHAQLTQLSSDLVDAINLYHSLMRDDRAAMLGATGGMAVGAAGAAYMPGMPNMPGAMPAGMSYQGPLPAAPTNAQMLYGMSSAGYPGSNMPLPPPNFSYAAGLAGMPSYASAQAAAATTQQQAAAANNPMAPLSVSTNSTGVMPPYAPNVTGNAASESSMLPAAPMAIPMPYQNGHMQAANINMPPTQLQQQPQQQQQYAAQAPQAATPQQYISPQHNAATQQHYMQNATAQQQQQHSQATPQQYATQMVNGGQQQQYLPATVGMTATGMLQQQMPPSMHQQQPNSNNMNGAFADQFNQLQHQMAAMSMGLNHQQQQQQQQQHHQQQPQQLHPQQPVTQSFLMQNETKNNIPIYQQQR